MAGRGKSSGLSKGPAKGAGKSKGTSRGKFALPGGHFPLNTPGRIAAAPGMASRALKAGHITAAQAATVRRKAAAARGRKKK